MTEISKETKNMNFAVSKVELLKIIHFQEKNSLLK